MKRAKTIMVTFAAVGAMSACEPPDAAQASLRVSIYGEEFIEDKIPAAEVVDGWEIEFSTFLVSVRGIAADGEPVAGAHLFDLTVPSGGEGHEVAEILVPSGLTEHLDYEIAPADSFDGGNAPAAQRSMMASSGYSMYVEGTAAREGETKTFAWGFSNATLYTHCHIDRDLAAGEADSAEITIHADHLFYDDLESEEPNVAFDLLARADVDGDDEVTPAELEGLDITAEARYQVGSRPISDLWGFVAAQTATVGHFDGEGHCDAEPM
jgi:hypothetical protein